MKKWIWIHRREIVRVWDFVGTVVLTMAETIFIRRTGKISGLPFFLLVVWFLVAAVPVIYANLRRSKKVNEQLNNFCDPEPMLHWAEENLDYHIRSGQARKQRSVVNVYLNSRAVALNALGRYEQAMDTLQSVDPETASFQMRVVYYTNIVAFLFNLGQLSQAEDALEKAQDIFAQNKKSASFVQDSLLLNRMALAIEKGETQGVEEELLSLLDRATTEYARVTQHDMLARLYLRERRFSEAREHLEYVVAHGNKLYARTKAEELLRTLPGGGEAEADPTYQSKYDQ